MPCTRRTIWTQELRTSQAPVVAFAVIYQIFFAMMGILPFSNAVAQSNAIPTQTTSQVEQNVESFFPPVVIQPYGTAPSAPIQTLPSQTLVAEIENGYPVPNVLVSDNFQSSLPQHSPTYYQPTLELHKLGRANQAALSDRAGETKNRPIHRDIWWEWPATRQISTNPVLEIDVDSLVYDALIHSAKIESLTIEPLIAETEIDINASQFDSRLFADSKYTRTSLPTGSVLDAGSGINRLRDGNWSSRAGWRRKTMYGGKWEAYQQVGLHDSNSQFFLPNQQGTTRLALSFSQPLQQGSGKYVNTALIVEARLDSEARQQDSITGVQNHLQKVTELAWDLYLDRVLFLQQRKHLERGIEILNRLQTRRSFDALESQIARASAAVAARESDLIRAGASIANTESRLRAAVNSPTLNTARNLELVPSQPPSQFYIQPSAEESVFLALKQRQEIFSLAKQMDAARVRLRLAQDQLRPTLDLVMDTYLSGLQGEYDIARSWLDQFSVGEPSFSGGLVYELPVGRREAHALQRRRKLELQQMSAELEALIGTITAETEIAVREVDTSYHESQAKFLAMQAAERDLQYLEDRWKTLPGDDRSASFALVDLLDSQERLVASENDYVRSQVTFVLSKIDLQRVTGQLLQLGDKEQFHEP